MSNRRRVVIFESGLINSRMLARLAKFLEEREVDVIISNEEGPEESAIFCLGGIGIGASEELHTLIRYMPDNEIYGPVKNDFAFRGGSKKKGGKTKYKRCK